MAIDPSRAALINREFRYVRLSDFSVRSTYPQAREITLDTQLQEAPATALANQIFNDTKTFKTVFQVEIDGTLELEDFDLSVPTYILDAPDYATDGRVLKLIYADIDYQANATTLTVRG